MTILLVGHGSRDPRSAARLRRLAARVSALAPEDVRLAFLELSEPLLEDVAAGLSGDVRVVPLLLGHAFHARVDLPGRLAALERPTLSLRQAPVLGPDPALDAAVAERGRRLGTDGVLLVGTGSSHAPANAQVDDVARRVAGRLGRPVVAGFVTRGRPVEEAIARLRSLGAGEVGLVPWFLAPGRLLDSGVERAAAHGATALAPTLADDDRVARLVLARAASEAALAA